MTPLRLVVDNKPRRLSDSEIQALARERLAEKDLREAEERERRAETREGTGAAIAFVIALWLALSIFGD